MECDVLWVYRASLIAQMLKNHLQCRRPWFDSCVRKICWRRDRLPTPVFLGYSGGSASKELTCNVGDLGSIPGFQRYPGEGKGYPLQYSGLENSMDCIVHRVAKSQTRLKDILFHIESESHSVLSDSFDPMDYTIHGILQTRILEWVVFPFSRGSSQPRDRT